MPTYEYTCKKCGNFEAFQRITEDPLEKCPECGSAVKRLISTGAGIIFKGSGFYTTDYKSNGSESTGTGQSKANNNGDPASE